jgi:glycosyltransferase involved in cell wall biosynthesis
MTTLVPTILLPAYNAQSTITEAVCSMLAQTHREFVLFILDDGSTDSTPDLALGFTKLDSRVRHIRNEKNLGLIGTLNKGLSLAETEWVARMDADDLCDPDRLRIQAAHLHAHPDLTVLSSQGRLFGTASGPIRFPVDTKNIQARMFFDTPVLHAAAWLNKNWLHEKGIQYDPLALYAEDYDLFATIQENGGLIDNLPNEMYHYRIHEKSVTQSKRAAQEKTATGIRNRLMVAEGVVLTDEELDYTAKRQFFQRPALNDFDLYLLRSIDGKVRTLPHLGSPRSVFSLYERGRFLVSMLPRPKSLTEKLVLAKSLAQINPMLAAVFLPLYLNGRA